MYVEIALYPRTAYQVLSSISERSSTHVLSVTTSVRPTQKMGGGEIGGSEIFFFVTSLHVPVPVGHVNFSFVKISQLFKDRYYYVHVIQQHVTQLRSRSNHIKKYAVPKLLSFTYKLFLVRVLQN
jgi:hypothetical protein